MHGNTTEQQPKSARDYKMVVLGHRAVGKSALVVRFLTNRFISEYQENSEMTCNGDVIVDGERLRLKIQDTSEKSIRIQAVDHHYRWADAIMLVYSITDKMSYQRLRDAAKRLEEKTTEHETIDDKIPAMVVVGNKGDLDHLREVQTKEGLQLAEELCCEFYETSASEGWSRHFTSGKNGRPCRNQGLSDEQRPTTLWNQQERKSPNRRRKSDPSIVLNSIFGLKVPTMKSPENDMNNNDSKRTLMVPPAVPEISISPSEDVPSDQRPPPSRGRKLMQKLSPRLSRKFGGSKQTQPRMPSIGAGLAKMSATSLVAGGSIGRDRCNTLPTTNLHRTSLAAPGSQTLPTGARNPIIRVDRKLIGSLSTSSSSNNSSTESLVAGKESDPSAMFFLRPETPVSDLGVSSSEDEFGSIQERTTINGRLAVQQNAGGHIRRSRSICRGLNLEELTDDRRCNSDSDSSKQHLSPGKSHKRGSSETRFDCRNFNTSVSLNSQSMEHDVMYQKKFNASEPFKHLCREARSARRIRDRKTPSKFIRDGIRKIKTSFSTDHPQTNSYQGHYKNAHFHLTAGGH